MKLSRRFGLVATCMAILLWHHHNCSALLQNKKAGKPDIIIFISDDHGYAFGGTPLTCERETHPFGDWAEYGIYAEDSSNVHMKDLDIHGFGI